MDRLLELLQTSDAALRLNSLWAVKNLLRNSTTETKRSVMSKLGWDRVVKFVIISYALRVILISFARYLQESPTDVQEQAYNILRNVAETHEGIDLVFKNISIEVLTGHITNAITSSSDDVALQVGYTRLAPKLPVVIAAHLSSGHISIGQYNQWQRTTTKSDCFLPSITY